MIDRMVSSEPVFGYETPDGDVISITGGIDLDLGLYDPNVITRTKASDEPIKVSAEDVNRIIETVLADKGKSGAGWLRREDPKVVGSVIAEAKKLQESGMTPKKIYSIFGFRSACSPSEDTDLKLRIIGALAGEKRESLPF